MKKPPLKTLAENLEQALRVHFERARVEVVGARLRVSYRAYRDRAGCLSRAEAEDYPARLEGGYIGEYTWEMRDAMRPPEPAPAATVFYVHAGTTRVIEQPVWLNKHGAFRAKRGKLPTELGGSYSVDPEDVARTPEDARREAIRREEQRQRELENQLSESRVRCYRMRAYLEAP